jgi:uncharacterized membrane protein
MHTWTKRSLVLVMMASLVFTTAGFSAFAQGQMMEDEASAESMMADVVFLRPLGFAGLIIGEVFFVASLPFTVITGSTGEAFDKLVADPSTFTFDRPLGNID